MLNATQFAGSQQRSRAAFQGRYNGRASLDRGLGSGRSMSDQGLGTGVSYESNATSQFNDFGEDQQRWRALG